jgi:hypothetical protein
MKLFIQYIKMDVASQKFKQMWACFKDTMTTKEDLVTFGCVSHCQVLLCMGRIGKQELV